ncbi:MAG: hydrolase [Bacteroidales bacterium]|nr:hydrolase [Bacteroidales bacterium]
MRIEKKQSAGLVIDIQEKLYPHMDQKEELLRKTSTLLEGFRVLQIPLLITEQYPKGLGPTLEPVSLILEREQVIEKISFSCCDEPVVSDKLKSLDRNTIIICGIEAHVCVLQTVVDLVEQGYRAVVVEDCISSRNPVDRRVAVERMRSEGAIITTCESVLFELARVAGTDEFKAISRLVK